MSDVISAALAAGFTCVQVRSKVCSARELMACADEAARAIERAGASEKVALLIDDRLDVAFAAREAGVKVDGVHVGQSDVPVEACRKLLGPDAVVGLSARVDEMLEYVKTADMSLVDYLGVGLCTKRPQATADSQPTVLSSRKASMTCANSPSQAPFPSWSAGE